MNKMIFVFFFLVKSLYAYPRWYVIGETKSIKTNVPHKIVIKNMPITIWKDENNRFAAIHDVCPHRGASLAKGRIDAYTGCVVCPYHTFKFNEKGRMIQTPGTNTTRTQETYNLKTDVPHYDIIQKAGWIYLRDEPLKEISSSPILSDIWVEPEAYDPLFRSTCLQKTFQIDARTVTENSLDILHISEVHAFGNRKRPLPVTEKVEKINEEHYKIIYEYEAGEDSIARKLFHVKELIVENEFVLPHYTVARVKFGPFVNTIVTSAMPKTERETILYVKAYRNNWVFPMFPLLNQPFDHLTKQLMHKTLNEDKRVIESIYYENRDGHFITKYDEFTKLYRELLG